MNVFLVTWDFKIKPVDSTETKNFSKARCCAHGDKQIADFDYDPFGVQSSLASPNAVQSLRGDATAYSLHFEGAAISSAYCTIMEISIVRYMLHSGQTLITKITFQTSCASSSGQWMVFDKPSVSGDLYWLFAGNLESHSDSLGQTDVLFSKPSIYRAFYCRGRNGIKFNSSSLLNRFKTTLGSELDVKLFGKLSMFGSWHVDVGEKGSSYRNSATSQSLKKRNSENATERFLLPHLEQISRSDKSRSASWANLSTPFTACWLENCFIWLPSQGRTFPAQLAHFQRVFTTKKTNTWVLRKPFCDIS